MTVVPRGSDRESLATAPLDALELADELRATLARWGLTTLGELAALPRRGLADRLGAAGLRAHDLAHGRDLEPFRPYTPPPFWEEALGLDWEIDTIPALTVALDMVLRGSPRASPPPVSPPTRSRCAWGWRCRRVTTVCVPLAYPLREPGPMLALLRLSLETHPPPAPVTRIAVSASAVALRPAPRELWEPAGPATRDLETVLARLVTLARPQNVGSPVITDSHRPDAFALVPFVPPAGTRVETGGGMDMDTRALAPPRSRYVACVPPDASRWRPTARPAPAAGAPRGCSSTDARPCASSPAPAPGASPASGGTRTRGPATSGTSSWPMASSAALPATASAASGTRRRL